MIYKILILRKAQKELAKLPAATYKKIKSKIAALAKNPRPTGSKKLTGREAWRIRIGTYRVIYEIKDEMLTVIIIKISHRKDAYNP